jgi:hypothetical protein
MKKQNSKIRLSIVAAFILALATSGKLAFAITQATPDQENIYSNVGLFAVDGGEPDLWIGCSGTLISPTVFLTAAHCMNWLIGTEFPIYVTLDNFIYEGRAGNSWIRATDFFVHPRFGHDQANLYDLAVIILEKELVGVTPATLTTAGLLDELSAHGGLTHTDFISAGYGAQADWEKGPPQFFWDGWRNYASAPIMALTLTQIYLNINEHATGGGGACYGDSGGPIFLPMGNTKILVGVTSLRSDRPCRAMTTYYRIDTPWSRDWLGQFVELP